MTFQISNEISHFTFYTLVKFESSVYNNIYRNLTCNQKKYWKSVTKYKQLIELWTKIAIDNYRSTQWPFIKWSDK